jgi:hypothetical protein
VRVHINAAGREVLIDTDPTNVTVDQIVDKALETWQATAGVDRGTEGPGFGVQAETAQARTTTGSLVIGVVE